jgi:hypothetical protein
MSIKMIMESWNKYINESSLSRTHQHIMEHDTAMLTGYRGDPTDMSKCAIGSRADKAGPKALQINKMRNEDLMKKLRGLGYGVTSVLGSYVEDYMQNTAREVKEASLFVVNLNDDPDFFAQIENLGQYFCQDSVLMIPKGGKGAYLLGTNNSSFPGFGQKSETGEFAGGEEGEFMTRVGDRPLVFR